MSFVELIPFESLDVSQVPVGSKVSLTASSSFGFERTLSVASSLIKRGVRVVPHVSAGLLSFSDVDMFLSWAVTYSVDEIFVIGGDDAGTDFFDAVSLLGELAPSGVFDRIGVAGYPEGLPGVDERVLHDALMRKLVLLEDNGVSSWVSTQMCFDSDAFNEFAAFLKVPVFFGVPASVRLSLLLRVASKVGMGPSLKFVSKNRSFVKGAFSFDPLPLIDAASERSGLHVFSFNDFSAFDLLSSL